MQTVVIRYCLPVLVLLITNKAQAQTYHGWKLGLSGGPVHYWYYNKGLLNFANEYTDKGYSSPYFVQNNLGLFNGYSIGLCSEKNYHRRWSLRGELVYSHQTQSYITSNTSIKDKPILNYRVNSVFNYIKLPIMLGYQIPLSKRKPLYLQLNQGLQFSFLQDYELIRKGRTPWGFEALDSNGQSILVFIESKEIERFSKNELFQDVTNDLYSLHNKQTYANWPYRRFLVGTITDIGIKGQLPLKLASFEHWYYMASVRFEYDFISSDANNNSNLSTGMFLEHYADTKYKTHNIRLGLNFNLMYHFNKR